MTLYGKLKKTKIIETILNNKRTAEGLIISYFKLYNKARVIKQQQQNKQSIGAKTNMLIKGIKLRIQT